VRVAPADPYLREGLSGAWLAQKPPRTEEALEQMSQAERVSPFNAVYPAAQARLRRNAGEWPQVLDLASRAVFLEPDYLQARLLRAEAFLELGRPEEARGELSEVDRRSAALGGRLNSGSGYDAFIMSFDRAGFEELVRRAAVR
jgi:tetratricopeptide (TPR) repeat protein